MINIVEINNRMANLYVCIPFPTVVKGMQMICAHLGENILSGLSIRYVRLKPAYCSISTAPNRTLALKVCYSEA